MQLRRHGPGSTRSAVAFDPRNDIAVLRVPGSTRRRCRSRRARGRARRRRSSASRTTGPRRARRRASAQTRDGASPRTPTGAARCARLITSLRGARALRQLRRPDGRRPRARGRRRSSRRTDARPARRLRGADTPWSARRSSGARAAPVSTGPCAADSCTLAGSLPSAAPWPRPSSSPRSPPSGGTSRASLPGPFAEARGLPRGSDEHVITWAVGHLVQLAEPDDYDAKFKKWRMADLPIVPDAASSSSCATSARASR